GSRLIISTQSIPPTPGTHTPTILRINNSSPLYNPSCNLATPVVSLSGNVLSSSYASGNQWYLNGNAITGASNQTYTPPVDGNYSVLITTGMCVSPASNVVSYAVTGINQVVLQWGLTIGPNPVNDQL